MDWKYKHFNQSAIYNALPESVFEAARAAVGESLGGITDTADGFVARGGSAFHPSIATVRITPAAAGTQVAVELLVERYAGRGFMWFDVGGYYNGQIDKWFTGIGQRLGDTQGQALPLISKTTPSTKLARGCLAGCLVYLVLGACLVIAAIPLDNALSGQSGQSTMGPFSAAASSIGLLAGVVVFLFAAYPEAPLAKSIRKRLQRSQNK